MITDLWNLFLTLARNCQSYVFPDIEMDHPNHGIYFDIVYDKGNSILYVNAFSRIKRIFEIIYIIKLYVRLL